MRDRPPARAAATLAALVASSLPFVACRIYDAPRGPEETCARECGARAPHCTEATCFRGCGLALDKLLEGEGARVLSCVARAPDCDDRTWARCATLTGVHADGGPPPPPAPAE